MALVMGVVFIRREATLYVRDIGGSLVDLESMTMDRVMEDFLVLGDDAEFRKC
jgi:hypothetical protein